MFRNLRLEIPQLLGGEPCGKHVGMIKRYGLALASRPVVDFRPGSMNAAGRLAAWAVGPEQSAH